MITLGIETSCDETSCAILEGSQTVRSNIVSSSLARHKPFGGVVPEIACRHHVENIDAVFGCALKEAGVQKRDIDLVSVTRGPGLIGALLVGLSFAKALAFALKRPLVGVNHLEAHLEAVFLEKRRPKDAFVGLVVSGGHTLLVHYSKKKGYVVLGETRDDACGEAFDKVAKILGLGYPGGPIIDRLSEKGDPGRIPFVCANLDESFDFSFSGIKTAVFYYVRRRRDIRKEAADIAASFQHSVVSCLVEKTLAAARRFRAQSVVVGGGVSANRLLRSMLTEACQRDGIDVLLPSLEYSQDNAAMVARCGYEQYRRGKRDGLDMTADARLVFGKN